MQVRFPTPRHGWRAFWGEVGIIVLGVLIALGAGQIVEQWQWHRKVAAVRASLTSELANDRARWEWDVSSTRCAVAQIDALDRWLQAPRPVQPMPSTSAITSTALFLWMHSANWSLATGSDALNHFPMDEQLSYASVYDGIAHQQVPIERAADLMAQVTALLPFAAEGSGRHDLRLALAALKSKLIGLTTDADYMRRHFDALRIRPDQRDFAADIGGPACRR